MKKNHKRFNIWLVGLSKLCLNSDENASFELQNSDVYVFLKIHQVWEVNAVNVIQKKMHIRRIRHLFRQIMDIMWTGLYFVHSLHFITIGAQSDSSDTEITIYIPILLKNSWFFNGFKLERMHVRIWWDLSVEVEKLVTFKCWSREVEAFVPFCLFDWFGVNIASVYFALYFSFEIWHFLSKHVCWTSLFEVCEKWIKKTKRKSKTKNKKQSFSFQHLGFLDKAFILLFLGIFLQNWLVFGL